MFKFIPKNPLFLCSSKFLFFFIVGLYILVLPIQTIKFNLVDGISIYGYINPPYVLLIENLMCITISIISSFYSLVELKKIIRIMRGKGEEK